MLTLDFKAAWSVTEGGEVEGLASVFGTADRGGDVVHKGAFASATFPLPMLDAHDPTAPIGVWESGEETPEGLRVKGRLILSVERAREVRDLILSKSVAGLSIGYRAIKRAARVGGGRDLFGVELVEISVVAVPMHPGARIISAKGAQMEGGRMDGDDDKSGAGGRKRPHVPWPDDAIAKFRAEAAPFQRLVFEIGIGTVQRPSDWLRFTWGDYDGDSLKVVQGKTGVKLTLPCSDHLRAVLDAARPEHASDDAPIIMGRSGPLTYQAMADAMRAERERLGLMAYDLHALRYRGVMELAWAGCDDDEIAAFSGHNTKAMIIKYAGEARQIMRARTAREKRGRTEKAQS